MNDLLSTEALMKNRVTNSLFYITKEGLLFIQFGKAVQSFDYRFYQHFSDTLPDGTVIEGNVLRRTKTGIVLSDWSINNGIRSRKEI